MSELSLPEWPAHVIGNGPSKALWKIDEHLSEMSIGCNLEERCRITSLYDRKILDEASANKRRIRRPAILVGNAAEHCLQDGNAFRKMVVVGLVHKKPLRIFNAGHGAIVWALRCGYSPIHLWGFDSIWNGLRETDSDAIWPRGPNLSKAPDGWAKSWSLIFDVYKDLVLNVHCPEGVSFPRKSQLADFRHHFHLLHEPTPHPV